MQCGQPCSRARVDLGFMGGTLHLAQGDMRKGYPMSQEFPSLSLSNERCDMVWILGRQRESAIGDEMLDTLQTPLLRP